MTPTILVPCPTSFDPAYNQQCWPEYATAVERLGATAVMVPSGRSEETLRRWAETAHGILLPGSGADIAPSRYGHEQQAETAPSDPERERIDTILLEAAEKRRIPTLAICFGLQSLNVHRGGTLVQHLQPVPVNHRAGRAVAQAHASVLSSDSRLGHVLASAGDIQPDTENGFLRFMVNSSHHQAVGIPGDGLRVSARSTEDGVIEALEDGAHPFLIGVQWHPERTFEHSEASRYLLQAFVQAARQHA